MREELCRTRAARDQCEREQLTSQTAFSKHLQQARLDINTLRTRCDALQMEKQQLQRDVTDERQKLTQKLAMLEKSSENLKARNRELEIALDSEKASKSKLQTAFENEKARKCKLQTAFESVADNYWIFLRTLVGKMEKQEYRQVRTPTSAVQSGFQALDDVNARLQKLSGGCYQPVTQVRSSAASRLPKSYPHDVLSSFGELKTHELPESTSELLASTHELPASTHELPSSTHELPASHVVDLPPTPASSNESKRNRTLSVKHERKQLSPVTLQTNVPRGLVIAGLHGLGPVTHPLDVHAGASDADRDVLHGTARVRSATATGARRFPLRKSFTTDDDRIVARKCLSSGSLSHAHPKYTIQKALSVDVTTQSDDDSDLRLFTPAMSEQDSQADVIWDDDMHSTRERRSESALDDPACTCASTSKKLTYTSAPSVDETPVTSASVFSEVHCTSASASSAHAGTSASTVEAASSAHTGTSASAVEAASSSHTSAEAVSAQCSAPGLWLRRNGITAMPMEVSLQLRMSDAKKNRTFSDLMDKFMKEKSVQPSSSPSHDKKVSSIKRFSRKKSKSSKS